MKNKIFLIILLSLYSNIYAQIKYVDIIPDSVCTVQSSGVMTYYLDIDSNNVNDFAFFLKMQSWNCPPRPVCWSPEIDFYPFGGSLFSCYYKNEGQIIDSLTQGWIGNLQPVHTYFCCRFLDGCWVENGNGNEFSPVKFKINNQFHYGWIRVSISYDQIIVKSYAYNTVAGQPIIASDYAKGFIIGGDSICLGNKIDTLKLISYLGNINKWQKRNNGGTWLDIANTSTTYTETPSAYGAWEYRAEVQYGTNIGYSSTATVFVNDIPLIPTISQSGMDLTSSSPTGNQWYWNENFIPGASSQNFTCTINGSYTDIVTINNCSSAPSEPVIINVGMEEINNKYGFIIYPNPAEENLTININSVDFSDIKLSIFNIQGQLVLQQPIKQTKSDINILQWREGVYIAKINFGDGTITQEKFVIIK